MQNNMTDKQKHFSVGFLFAVLIAPLTYFFDFNTLVIWNFLISSVVFIGKELKDRKTSGFDKVDLFCDYLGWFGGCIVAFWIVGLLKIIFG